MSNNKLFAIIASVVVLAAIVAAVMTTGGPARQRQLQFDKQRVADLENIQGQIVNYWQQKNKLPATLGDLTDSISGFKAPVDPETKQAYEYIIQSGLNFQLCANFNLESQDARQMEPAIYPYYNWDHSAGRVCFDRNIDPELYKPVPVQPIPLKGD